MAARSRRFMVLASGLALLIVGTAGAEAARISTIDVTEKAAVATTRTVDAIEYAYTPAKVTAVQGDFVKWTNRGVLSHTTTSTITGAVGWNNTLAPGGSSSKSLPGAGTYAYHCNFHPMTGNVRVRVSVTPTTGPVGTTFTLKVASAPAPTGYSYAPQVKVPGSTSWTSLPTTTATSVSYVANKAGIHAFRSKVKHGSLAGTAPSPTVSVTVG
ncbi:MAG: hypothetical protein H0V49_10985 [Nocardioidaceae bacterium]|nr:hypothetical protein [Nocardioidaceae bacterium]